MHRVDLDRHHPTIGLQVEQLAAVGAQYRGATPPPSDRRMLFTAAAEPDTGSSWNSATNTSFGPASFDTLASHLRSGES